jgi:hypothetical protein
MPNVYIVRWGARKAAQSMTSSEDHADHVLAAFKTQREAIEWARKNNHSPLVARVRHLNDKKIPDHWRAA